jgi:hypothetical protein
MEVGRGEVGVGSLVRALGPRWEPGPGHLVRPARRGGGAAPGCRRYRRRDRRRTRRGMRILLRTGQTTGVRSGQGRPAPSRARHRFRSAAESGILAGLLLAVVASVMAGSQAALLGSVLGAWLALGTIVGARDVLDAGCFFMLLVAGVILVLDLVSNGPGSLLLGCLRRDARGRRPARSRPRPRACPVPGLLPGARRWRPARPG